MIIRMLLAAFMVASLALPAGAQQRPTCGNYVEVAAFLKAKLNQEAVAHGIDAAGRVVQVHISPGGATWTVTVSIPGGPTCLAATGADWVLYERKAPESDS